MYLFKKCLYDHLSSNILYICLIAFFWYANKPGILERKFFANEIFSIIGFFLFLSKPVLYIRKDYIYNTVIVILSVFFFYMVLSLFIFENFHGYLRNTVIVYSVFSFFLGLRLFGTLSRISKINLFFLSALFPSGSFYRTSYAVLLPLYLSRYSNTFNIVSLFGLISVMAGVAVYYGGQTAFLVILMLLLLHIMNRWIQIVAFICLALLSVSFFIFINPYMDALLEGNWYSVEGKHILLGLDANLTMRFYFWGYVFFERFSGNLFGIGLGTPLMSEYFVRYQLFLQHGLKGNELIEYTLGPHNSYLTILARCGIIGIIPFIVLYWKLTADFIQCKANPIHRKQIFFFYAFFIISGSATVNVVLESPMQASLYWGTLGMLCQARRDNAYT